jgi:ubiquinone/menaquinone biosynthesis C-methylase UbiE
MWGGGHPHGFDPMPELQRAEVREDLLQRIRFEQSDWAQLPLADGSVDVVFATNALPRGNDALRVDVLKEWTRVIRPGGLVFCTMHNDPGLDPGGFFEKRGLVRIDALRGETGPAGANTFQHYLSSG